MGGGGFLGLGPAPSPPPAPDYVGAANATAAGNLQAAQTATAANRVNQVTPYGNLTYRETGTDSKGNPMWTATTDLSPIGQQLLNAQNATSLGLSSLLNTQGQNVANTINTGFNPQLPSYGINPNETYSDAIMRRLAPTLQHQREMSDAQLANQGIKQGSEAWNNAKRALSQQQNDQLTSAIVGGMNTGLQANQQAYNQAMTNYNLPLNTLSALRTGSQVTNPTFSNVPQQATTAGADILGATTQGYNNQLAGFNAANAAQANLNSGLFSLGGTAMMAAALSDIRTKENIELVGWLPNGLPVYEFDYKDEYKDHPNAGQGRFTGLIAQDVQKVQPEAVVVGEDGLLMINYGALQ